MSNFTGSSQTLVQTEPSLPNLPGNIAAFSHPSIAFQPIAPPQDTQTLHAEVAALPPEQLLFDTSEYSVFTARSWQMPHLMDEIGRLREITFRAVGEGTGKASDIDRFDSYYDHLFVWHHERHEVVGAYRLGKVDEILKIFGKKGLYTNTLFHFKKTLFRELGLALELGRSFVRAEYQKTPLALLLLWKGIGHFLLRHPQYKTLFGPVSISNTYQETSQQLIVEFLSEQNFAPELAKYVKARNPFECERTRSRRLSITDLCKSIEEVSAFIGNIEEDNKGVPVLLRQYLKLGARVISFNVDADFCNSLDVLIVVDLVKADRRMLERFMGEEISSSLSKPLFITNAKAANT